MIGQTQTHKNKNTTFGQVGWTSHACVTSHGHSRRVVALIRTTFWTFCP